MGGRRYGGEAERQDRFAPEAVTCSFRTSSLRCRTDQSPVGVTVGGRVLWFLTSRFLDCPQGRAVLRNPGTVCLPGHTTAESGGSSRAGLRWRCGERGKPAPAPQQDSWADTLPERVHGLLDTEKSLCLSARDSLTLREWVGGQGGRVVTCHPLVEKPNGHI